MAEHVSAMSVNDAQIRERIRTDYARYGVAWCPHTATAAEVYANLPESARTGHPWVLVATAHPAKFNDVVEPLTGSEVPVPAALAELLSLPSLQQNVAPTLDALRLALKGRTA
jgi:threonine synthase